MQVRTKFTLAGVFTAISFIALLTVACVAGIKAMSGSRLETLLTNAAYTTKPEMVEVWLKAALTYMANHELQTGDTSIYGISDSNNLYDFYNLLSQHYTAISQRGSDKHKAMFALQEYLRPTEYATLSNKKTILNCPSNLNLYPYQTTIVTLLLASSLSILIGLGLMIRYSD